MATPPTSQNYRCLSLPTRKTRPPGELWCPVCGMTLRAGDFESHLGFELENLAKHLQGMPPTPRLSPVVSVTSSSPHRMGSLIRARDPGWETYQRVRANRQVRLRTKKRRSGRTDGCPVCGDRISATSPEEIQNHVEQCIRRSSLNEEDADVDIEGDSPFEEYEWCGQRRVRVNTASRPPNMILPVLQREPDVKTSLGDKDQRSPNRENGATIREDPEGAAREVGMSDKESEKATVALEKELESLKEKIQTLEKDSQGNPKFSCFVCQRTYERPAVSLICWHVFCENCWPNSRETKAECPQCSTVFNADDIRNIHL